QVRGTARRKTTTSSAAASSGSAAKRMNMNGAKPRCSSTYFTVAKFTPHTTIVASTAESDQPSLFNAADALPGERVAGAARVGSRVQHPARRVAQHGAHAAHAPGPLRPQLHVVAELAQRVHRFGGHALLDAQPPREVGIRRERVGEAERR